jgi:hypothetical protein
LPLQPKTSLTAAFTDEDRRAISISVNTDLAIQINNVVSQLLSVCESPFKQGVLFIKQTALAAIAKRATLHSLKQELVKKATKQRRKKQASAVGRLLC